MIYLTNFSISMEFYKNQNGYLEGLTEYIFMKLPTVFVYRKTPFIKIISIKLNVELSYIHPQTGQRTIITECTLGDYNQLGVYNRTQLDPKLIENLKKFLLKEFKNHLEMNKTEKFNSFPMKKLILRIYFFGNISPYIS